MAYSYYNCSAIKVNGTSLSSYTVNSTPVKVNGSTCYRLQKDGTDLIHKYNVTEVTKSASSTIEAYFTLTGTWNLTNDEYDSCDRTDRYTGYISMSNNGGSIGSSSTGNISNPSIYSISASGNVRFNVWWNDEANSTTLASTSYLSGNCSSVTFGWASQVNDYMSGLNSMTITVNFSAKGVHSGSTLYGSITLKPQSYNYNHTFPNTGAYRYFIFNGSTTMTDTWTETVTTQEY